MKAQPSPSLPPTIRIEPARLTAPHAQRLIAELNAELSATYPEPGATHFGLETKDVAAGEGMFVIAYRDDEPVGCGALRRVSEPDAVSELGSDVGELKRMYVVPAMRGRGVGRAILARLEAEARSLGLNRIVLETGTRQREALRLYERAGYVVRAPFGEYRSSPATSVCMEKSAPIA